MLNRSLYPQARAYVRDIDIWHVFPEFRTCGHIAIAIYLHHVHGEHWKVIVLRSTVLRSKNKVGLNNFRRKFGHFKVMHASLKQRKDFLMQDHPGDEHAKA